MLSRYLLVLHDIDESAELVARARELATANPGAEFVLLVPATPFPFDLLLEPALTGRQLARRRAQRVREQLLAAAVPLVATRLGNFDPICAVEDALRFSDYTAVLVVTRPHFLLHFFHQDLPCRLARHNPDVHVVHIFSRASTPLSVSNVTHSSASVQQ